jgi:penicillin-binding protein 1A
VLQKLKEAALAYQIERQWSKDKILTNYLNNIYFGNGAYGIEAAARTYFGSNHPGCGTADNAPCASQLRVEEAAMLAGMISSPTAYDPAAHPEAAEERRNVVLEKMRELGTLEVSDTQMAELEAISAPGRTTIQPPSEDSASPYFTEWLRQQIVDRYGAGQAFGGGLEIESTLDLDLQQAAEGVVSSRLSGLGPTAAVVVIENGTGKVRAMVGGLDYESSAFNIATNGLRQPGSSFKPFTLVTALDNGVSPDTVYESKPVEIPFETTITDKNGEKKKVTDYFKVNNYDDNYLGSASVTTATTYSDNSVYAQLGTDVGTDKIAEMANRLGIQSRIDDNPAMILGGLKHGVSPLEMAYAYSTLANDGNKISGTMASRGIGQGPVGIESVKNDEGDLVPDNLGASGQNEQVDNEVLDPAVAQQARDILHTVVTSGTGKNAQVGDDYIWGKTGTTDSNIDAWFVGANESVTAAVWVGYPDGSTPMETEYGGLPVDGGTIPALIWHDVITAYDELQANRLAEKESGGDPEDVTSTESVPVTPTETTPVAPAPVEEAPAPAPAPTPTEEAPATPAEPAPTEPGPAEPAATDASGGTAPQP